MHEGIVVGSEAGHLSAPISNAPCLQSPINRIDLSRKYENLLLVPRERAISPVVGKSSKMVVNAATWKPEDEVG